MICVHDAKMIIFWKRNYEQETSGWVLCDGDKYGGGVWDRGVKLEAVQTASHSKIFLKILLRWLTPCVVASEYSMCT